ncbi:hypothetical protein [Ruficoccus sp. ZRK36]|uniref:InlB B-repeat-containing protein n=1 Tax=Ruficoccus sp. ZRK36 TaxID=2866311 RepID=UPI001C73CA32|nr:hypothetical protein [Ruficoccus sp. ZRK36]QYY34396.1 hypothetical protein K0V07_08730 [Ruficoccus sp. ZRK36]
MHRWGKQVLGALSLCLMTSGLQGQTDFFWYNAIVPAFDGEPNSEFAQFDRVQYAYTSWEDPFNTSAPTEVNTPTPASINPSTLTTNEDAVLAQIGTDTAFITSHPGIYSFSESMSFIVYDNPAYSPGQVIFQVNTVGSLPDQEAFIYFRETEGGPLVGPIPYTHIGFLTGGDPNSGDGQGIMAWEWDLSGYDVAEYYITFGSSGTSMSLWWATLDTWDGFSAELSNAIFPKTNTNFATGAVGSVEHELSGGGGPRITYEPGDEVVLTAVAEDGWVFVRWTGDVNSTSSSIVTTIDGNLDVKAIFAPQTYDKWKENIILPAFTGSNPVVNGARDADPNRNGLVNILEYAFGGTPEEISTPEAFPVAGVTEDGKHLTLTYRQQPEATDLTYHAMVSNDLESWNYNGDGSEQTYTSIDISPSINEDGTQTVIVTDLTDLSTLPAGTNRQMRLQVILE